MIAVKGYKITLQLHMFNLIYSNHCSCQEIFADSCTLSSFPLGLLVSRYLVSTEFFQCDHARKQLLVWWFPPPVLPRLPPFCIWHLTYLLGISSQASLVGQLVWGELNILMV